MNNATPSPSPQKINKLCPPETSGVKLFENTVIVYIISWGYRELKWDFNPMSDVFIRNGRGIQALAHRGEGHLSTEAEIELMWL